MQRLFTSSSLKLRPSSSLFLSSSSSPSFPQPSFSSSSFHTHLPRHRFAPPDSPFQPPSASLSSSSSSSSFFCSFSPPFSSTFLFSSSSFHSSSPPFSSSSSSTSPLISTPTLSVPPTRDPNAFVPVTTADLLKIRADDSADAKNAKFDSGAEKTKDSGVRPGNSRAVPSVDLGDSYLHPHPIWQGEYLEDVKQIHCEPKDFVDRLAYNLIRLIRFNFDLVSGYSFGKPTERKVIKRIVFLESIAAVPGSIAGMLRHLASLRRLQRDNGWIHTLYEEAENERMHLLTSLQVENPGPIMRGAIFISQGIFFNFFWVAYLFSPRFCHRLVGYLEEQAVKTYTQVITDLDQGKFPQWNNLPAPTIAKDYWKLDANAKWRDVLLMIRADEAHHRDVNHVFGDLKPDEINPFRAGH